MFAAPLKPQLRGVATDFFAGSKAPPDRDRAKSTLLLAAKYGMFCRA
jgi:hypothetical protein